jgi:GT2 family glycosyltransferase/glycosyltransferase involved in cell wall biosynthesis
LSARLRPGVVSVVVVNYRGAPETVECLRALADVAWPGGRLEVVVVDNASGDGSVEQIRAAAGPPVVVVQSDVNLGFAGGCNLGARHATGEYVGLLNNDARPDADWIAAAVSAFEHHPAVGAVASKVLDWEGRTVDFVDASMTWFGMGYKREVGRPDEGEQDDARDVLFATGAAMFVRSEVWRTVGGFDDRYFMFYEDVDLGWRLNVLGYRVRYVPSSVAYHRHHASMKGYGSWREHYLLERNALFTLYKNYGDELLDRVLPGALALAVRRGLARGGDDAGALDLALGAPPEEPPTAEVSRETLSGAYAVHAFVEALPELQADRRRIQSARRRSDAELLPLFRDPLEPAFADAGFLAAYRGVVEAFGVEQPFGTRRRVVVATEEPLTEEMAGPAIRAWAIAVALSAEHEVELVTLRDCTLRHSRFRCRSVTEDELRDLDEWCDVWVVGGLLPWICRWLERSEKVLVVDVYDPFHLEQLEQAKDAGDAGRVAAVDECTSALNAELARGDLFLCASARQRDFWLGQLAAVGRVNPQTYDDDPTLASLIAVVPFGVPEDPPVHERPAIRDVVPGIDDGDEVILWGGGIYNWLDPLTLLRAVDGLRRRRPRVRLVFLGLRHPNPAVPRMRMATEAEELSAALGLTGTHVFFNREWVPYRDRQNHLLEADVGVSTHLEHVETAFSFRTRVLDYLWASLPVVTTDGDALSELVVARGAGLTVPAGDVDALEDALFRLLDDDELRDACRRGAAAVAAELTWPAVLRPLLEFCRAPRRAPDRVAVPQAWPKLRVPRSSDLAADVALAREYLRDGGPAEVVRRAMGRVRRTVAGRPG